MTGPGEAPSLVILLSSYDGERFIAEQIESIRRQTVTRWLLLVRDDGSTDRTVEIVERLAARDARITLLRDGRGNLGPAQSFGALMEAALERGANHVAFADQDDVWREDKLALELEVLGQLEATAGREVPLLVHSDLAVVDESLHVIHPSFQEFHGLRYDPGAPLRVLLVQNVVTGCACVANRSLVRAAVPLPRVVMHDWWLALVAATLGRIRRNPVATVLYRQHGGNAAGGPGRLRTLLEAARRPAGWWRRGQAGFSASVLQAADLAAQVERDHRSAAPDSGYRAMLRGYRAAFGPEVGPLRRLGAVWRLGVRPASALGLPVFFWLRVLLHSGLSAEPPKEPSRPCETR